MSTNMTVFKWFFKNISVLVLCTKVASALEWLRECKCKSINPCACIVWVLYQRAIVHPSSYDTKVLIKTYTNLGVKHVYITQEEKYFECYCFGASHFFLYGVGSKDAFLESITLYLRLLIWSLQNNVKKAGKLLKPWQMGTHMLVLNESYPMNTSMTGF